MKILLIVAALIVATDAFSMGFSAGSFHQALMKSKLMTKKSSPPPPTLRTRVTSSPAMLIRKARFLRVGSSRLPLSRDAVMLNRLRMESSSTASMFQVEETEKKIPISLLSGFLGSGKTTLLKQVLENKGGLKVGVVVNDVAAVNIDSKLVKGSGSDGATRQGIIGGKLLDTSDVMELQNGCACCSASDELLESVMKLLVVAAQKNETYDRIVIEMSGVAEPKNVRKTFFEMKYNEHPVFDYADLQNMVTVIDSANFLPLYQTSADLHERQDLVEPSNDQYSDRKVVDLLTEQVEVADYILLNKQDLIKEGDDEKLRTIVSSLNPLADILSCSFGKADLDVVLGSKKDRWVANNDDEDDFRASLLAMKATAPSACTDPDCKDPTHTHAHSHSHNQDCHDADCKDPSHEHEHDHAKNSHKHSQGKDSHAHVHDEDCQDAACRDPSHTHKHTHAASHSHEHTHDVDCHDATCTDPSHSHTHATKIPSAEEKFGISSFVYSRRRPFNPDRLKNVIRQMPVVANSEQESKGGAWEIPERGSKDMDGSSPMRRIIRSKGFVWLTNFHRIALYWSHAGKFMDLKEFGMYWASTPLDYWPQGDNDVRQIVNDFGPKGYLWGDRRQEIVFIGVDMDRTKIEALLDECLATDEEMKSYEEEAAKQAPDRVAINYEVDPPIPMDAFELSRT